MQSKVSKCEWVLDECLERVPDNFDALRELLEYGLLRSRASEFLSMSDETHSLQWRKRRRSRHSSATDDEADGEDREAIAEEMAKKVSIDK